MSNTEKISPGTIERLAKKAYPSFNRVDIKGNKCSVWCEDGTVALSGTIKQVGDELIKVVQKNNLVVKLSSEWEEYETHPPENQVFVLAIAESCPAPIFGFFQDGYFYQIKVKKIRKSFTIESEMFDQKILFWRANLGIPPILA